RTLYDFEAGALITLKELYEKYNLQEHYVSFEEFHSIYRRNNDTLWSQYRYRMISKDDLRWMRFQMTLAEKNLFDRELAENIGNDYIALSPEKCLLFPFTHEVLGYLRTQYNLYLITNGFKEVQYKKIDKCNLAQYFTKVYTSEEVGFNKPEKAYFEAVIKDSGANIEDSLVIGDDPEVDIKGAATMAIDTVWFNTNGKSSAYPVTFEVNCLSKLKEILLNFFHYLYLTCKNSKFVV
ncbi:MAG TPA: YjjG family noncanonical pyrimidine nucleotidase, partial [Bacteroidales bacterium]|nr:YjjG family noncanonical pyrimidine nucleotidase [Bacteroidales bacterium]